jgi:hypothetical protein
MKKDILKNKLLAEFLAKYRRMLSESIKRGIKEARKRILK